MHIRINRNEMSFNWFLIYYDLSSAETELGNLNESHMIFHFEFLFKVGHYIFFFLLI